MQYSASRPHFGGSSITGLISLGNHRAQVKTYTSAHSNKRQRGVLKSHSSFLGGVEQCPHIQEQAVFTGTGKGSGHTGQDRMHQLDEHLESLEAADWGLPTHGIPSGVRYSRRLKIGSDRYSLPPFLALVGSGACSGRGQQVCCVDDD